MGALQAGGREEDQELHGEEPLKQRSGMQTQNDDADDDVINTMYNTV